MPAPLPTPSIRTLLPEASLSSLPAPVQPRAGAATRAPAIVDRVRGEFIEMRGFSPTVEQAARLFQLGRDDCSRVLDTLVGEGFLTQTSDGRYRRPSRP